MQRLYGEFLLFEHAREAPARMLRRPRREPADRQQNGLYQ